ncbi:hypothetical protein BpHYR1_010438 [Brachionus plicatilis]|uniref:Uncharacterized protein n=1 Tax=Brachionus plicatilis TaxID=10195 RepID=A0A3M7QWA0_BRAPC|nr:hypothetical protein BpHYR1_010438 [Brachionus plicatilis]
MVLQAVQYFKSLQKLRNFLSMFEPYFYHYILLDYDQQMTECLFYHYMFHIVAKLKRLRELILLITWQSKIPAAKLND